MMGPTHAASGALAGIGVAILADRAGIYTPTAAEAIIFTGITAGAALLPDLDHPEATIARTFGPITRGAAKLTSDVSKRFINATQGKNDTAVNGGHRGLTHTLLGIFIYAAIMCAAVAYWGTPAALVTFFLFVTFAMHSLFRKWTRQFGTPISVLIAVGITYLCWTHLPTTVSTTALTLAIIIGGVAHILGDAPTYSGVPNPFAPFIQVGGKRWGRVHLLPERMRVSASGRTNWACFVLFTGATIALIALSVSNPAALGVHWAPLTDTINTAINSIY